MDLNFKNFEVWFVTGSQHLYGEEALRQVARDAEEIARSLNERPEIPVTVVFKPVMTDAESIRRLVLEANAAERCIGLIMWMHTFS
ncbi:MAG TPA: L-arabinose isomerase, partial [Firmicutes bacterium]|nr:L-arabinose isomerase [Bacillota bacterium]